jgi:hypothetical protein
MKDKEMKDELQHRDKKTALKEKWGRTFMTQMGLRKGFL